MPKTYFMRLRCDADLKKAIDRSAALCDRQKGDQARYILKLALGLSTEEEDDRIKKRLKPHRSKLF